MTNNEIKITGNNYYSHKRTFIGLCIWKVQTVCFQARLDPRAETMTVVLL